MEPAGSKWRLVTGLLWPVRVLMTASVARSHTTMVREAAARVLPLTARQWTGVWRLGRASSSASASAAATRSRATVPASLPT